MGLGKKIVDIMQQAKAIQKVKEEAKSTPEEYFQAACNSAQAFVAHSFTNPKCSCLTSPLAHSMPSLEKSCGAFCATSGPSKSSTSFWSRTICVSLFSWPTRCMS